MPAQLQLLIGVISNVALCLVLCCCAGATEKTTANRCAGTYGSCPWKRHG